MASADSRPGDRHKHDPIAYRPPADVRPLLAARMEQTGRGASSIITEALREYLAKTAGRDTEAQRS
jgi:hypothetical protein